METLHKKKKFRPFMILTHAVFIFLSLSATVPLVLLVILSFSDPTSFLERGYSFTPVKWSLYAYEYLMKSGKVIASSYKVTIFVTIVGTAVGLIVTAMLSYVLTRRDYKFQRPVSFLVFFAMLFNAGMIPNYILMTQYYHLKDNVLALILPSLVSCWNVILLRTFFYDTPGEVIEAATIDGANEFRIFRSVMLPMAKPALATMALLMTLGYWNQWQSSMLYISKAKDQMLQYYLYRLLKEAELLRSEIQYTQAFNPDDVISDSIKFASAVVVFGPMLMVFPFFQKYFVRGISSGAVKG